MRRTVCMLLAALLLTATGCAQQAEGSEVSVEPVSVLCGGGVAGLVDRFAGMVSPQGETHIEKSDGAQVDEIRVKVGDEVKKGDVLFTYDMAQARLDAERAQLELEKLKYEKAGREEEKKQLEEDKDSASSDMQLEYSLEIREVEAAIQESAYNISLKEKEIAKMQETLKESAVYAPSDGRVRSINENGSTDPNTGNPLPFMSIMETDGFRIKGLVDESNAAALTAGLAVLVRSRVDDTVWRGTVSSVDWNDPQQNQSNYGDSAMVMSSKYPFYVELDDGEGLLLGQHVYIEPDYGTEGDTAAIVLPEFYLAEGADDPWVWAQDKHNKLEKRSVELGAYDQMMGTWEIVSGLSMDDCIAFPQEDLTEGMRCAVYEAAEFDEATDRTPEEPAVDLTDDMMVDMVSEAAVTIG